MLQEYVQCKLFSPITGQQVAIGSVCLSTLGIMLHHRPLDPGCYKVKVVTPMSGKENIVLPRPTDEASTIYEAIGGFVAWPIELVSTTMEPHKILNAASKTIVNSTFEINESSFHLSSRRDMVDSYTKRMSNFIWYHRGMGDTKHSIKLSDEIMGYEHIIEVDKADVGRLLEKKEISAAHTSLYIKYLWDTHCHNVDHMYGFLCPSAVSPGDSRRSLSDRQKYIANSIRGDIGMKMLLVPYNFGSHWVLLAFNVKDDTVYYLDPLRGEIPMDVQIFFDASIKMFWVLKKQRKHRNNTRWIKIKCPRLTNKIYSGYFVLRFMREIIDIRHTNSIPEEYYSKKDNFTEDEIDQIRVEWLEFFSKVIDN